MNEPNPKIVGSVLIGFAMVAAAYVISNFGETQRPIMGGQSTVATAVIGSELTRQPITVVDSNSDGIEDWREEFLLPRSIDLTSADTPTTPYVAPQTVTGQMGMRLFEDMMQTRGLGPFTPTTDEIIDQNLIGLEPLTRDQIIDTDQVIVIETTDTALYTYANALMQVVIDNNQPNIPSEIALLQQILDNPNNETARTQLASKAAAYQRMRDMTLNVPVPNTLVKEHLDLINSYNAVARNIEAMTTALEDPIVTLLRIKRFEDDASGLFLSLRNLYLALEPHAALFSIEDPAVLLVAFSPNIQ